MKVTPTLSIFLLLSLLLTVVLHAQQAADVRVSPPDSSNFVMPLDARIQASARIDTRDLMVWGTTVNVAPDSIANALVARLIDGSGPLGTQLRLSAAAARPYGFVQVIPLVDRFLVLWDDRRAGAEGLYARAVGIDGTILEDERRISTVAVAPDSAAHVDVLGDVSCGVALCWQAASQGGIIALRLDAQGRADGAAQRLGTTLQQILTYTSLPGLYVVRLDSGAGRVIYGNGRIDARAIPGGHLPDQFWLNADTSLARIAGHDLEIYASIYDAIPARVVSVPALDSGYKGTAVVARDTGSSYAIYFATIHVGSIRLTTFYRVEVGDLGSITMPVSYLVDRVENPSDKVRERYEEGGAGMVPGCSGSALITTWFGRINYYHYEELIPHGIIKLDYSLGADGRLKFDRSYISTGNLSINGPTLFLDSCAGPRQVTIRRTGDERASSVRDSIGGAFTVDSAATGVLGINLPQTGPGILLDGDSVLVLWRQAAHSFDLAAWQFSADTASRIDRFTNDTIPRYVPTAQLEPDPAYSNLDVRLFDTLRASDHGGSIYFGSERFEIITFSLRPNYRDQDQVIVENMGVLLARPEGWRTVRYSRFFHAYVDNQYNTGQPSEAYFAAWDPNRRESLFRAVGASGDSVIAITPDGHLAWWMKSVQVGTAVIPVDSAEYLTVSRDTLRHIRGSVATVSKIPAGDSGALYRRLLGSRFLRCTQRGTGAVLELWDLDGNAIDTVMLAADSAAGAPAIVEDPRDSSLLVVTMHDGARLTHLTKRLKAIARDSLISAARTGISHPAGVVRKDTLLVVWEDRRHGQPDIYGSSVMLPPPLVGSDDPNNHTPGDSTKRNPSDSLGHGAIISAGIDHVYPNPARGVLHVEGRISTTGTIEVVDPMGHVVKRQTLSAASPAVRQIELPVDDMIEGAYLLTLRSGADVSAVRFLVLR